jgi:hypothetical protein
LDLESSNEFYPTSAVKESPGLEGLTMKGSSQNGAIGSLTPKQQAAAKALAPYWPRGARDMAAMALAGGLLRADLGVETVEHFIEAVAEAANDEEIQKRVEVVRPTAEKLAAGDANVTGFPKLSNLIGSNGQGEAVVRKLRADLGLNAKVTLAELAEHKALPVEFLESLGLHDLSSGGVSVPYKDAGGKVIAEKVRTALEARNGSFWPKGKPPRAYGEDKLDAATAAGFQVIVEGESNCWALWFHEFPALGLPGSDTVNKTLAQGHVGNLSRVYVVQDPDKGGELFVIGVSRKLADLGWKGELLVVRLGGVKDPSDLHKQNPDSFRERFQEALDRAEPVSLPATPSQPEFQPTPWPSPLADDAYHGLAGEIVRAIEPHTEADPVALLIQILVGFGSLIGRTAHFKAEDDTHYLNEFVVLVGRTAKGRKGSSWGRVRRLLDPVDEEWAKERVQTGLSSGEGLIWAVRDAVMGREKVKEKGGPTRYEEVQTDPGIADKRLLIYEPEFALVLKQIERQGNTLSAILRQGWESGSLRTLTKNTPARATGAHISLIGHCTADELRRYLSTTEAANGYGNRHLWFCVRRSKELPDGSPLDPSALAGLQQRLTEAVAFAKQVGVMRRDPRAREIWHSVYRALSEGKPGMVGALLARAEAHVMRLACLYALLNRSAEVQELHLLAALALWDYAEQSVRFVFGDTLGDYVADEIMRALQNAPAGLTRNELGDLFGRNKSSGEIGRALGLLLEHGLARFEKEPTSGRPTERWFLVNASTRKTR